jgi:hypothetical protein
MHLLLSAGFCFLLLSPEMDNLGIGLGSEPIPPGTDCVGQNVASPTGRNSGHGLPILSAAAILGPTYGRILNKTVDGIGTCSLSLTNSIVPAPIFGSFVTAGNHKIISSYRRKNLSKNLAICLSFNPATLKCGCKETVPLLQRKDQPSVLSPKSRVLVLSDHCFPPTLQVRDHSACDCIAILRIEHGTLYELLDLFMSLVDIFKIQQGSIILISSVSHLAISGLGAYATDMADVIRKIKSRLEGVVESFPIVPLLPGGCDDQSLTRAIFVWLKAIQGYPFMGCTNVVISAFLADGTGGPQPAYRAQHRLPTNLELSCFKNVSSTGHPGLCKKIKSLLESRETPFISVLLCELSTCFDMSVCLSSSF